MRHPAPLPPGLPSTIFSTRQAARAGISPGRLRGTDLEHPFVGVRSPAGALLTFEDKCRALSLRLPADAMISGSSAARLRLVPLPLRIESDDRIHVTVPEGRRAIEVRGTRGHAARILPSDITELRGIRLSTAERMWCELARELTLSELVMAGDHIAHWRYPLSSTERLRDAVSAYPGRRGLRALRQALELLDARAESPQESRLRVLMVLNGIVGFEANAWIATSGGHRYRGDFVFAREKVIVEYQGEHHFDPSRQRADMTRKSRLAADHWIVIEVNADDWRDEAELIARIRGALAGRR